MGEITPNFFQKILQMEGGFQDNPKDVGNTACGKVIGTKYGVSAVAWQTWKKRCPAKSDIQNMTEGDAKAFYTWYRNFYRLDEIQNQALFEIIFNNVMGSPKQAGKALQRALNQFGYGLEEDGAIGSKTLAAVNHAAKQSLAATYNAVRAEWLAYLQGTNPAFRKGLITRVETHFPPLSSPNNPSSPSPSGVWVDEAKTTISGASKGKIQDLVWVLIAILPFGTGIWAITKLLRRK